MRTQLASLELRILVGELRNLEGSWLDRVYELQALHEGKAGKSIVLQLSRSEGTYQDSPDAASAAADAYRPEVNSAFRQSRNCKAFLLCLAPSAIVRSATKPAVSEAPGGFCSLLRHHLDNAKLLSLSQCGSERIVELVFSSKGRQLTLVVELFSKGNIMLLDEKSVILGAAEHQQWKDRTIRPGFAYSLPPRAVDFTGISRQEFSRLILSSEKDSVVKALAVDLGLSGMYSEYLCSAAGVDKISAPSQLSLPQLEALFSSLQKLLSMSPSPAAVLDESGSIVEALPFALPSAGKVKSFMTFNDAVEAVVLSQRHSAASTSRTSSFQRRIAEAEIMLAQQESTIKGMEQAAAESTRAAGLLYEHYLDVQRILEDYNRLRKSFTPEQLRQYFKPNKKVVSIDEKTGTVTVELPN